MEKGVDSQIHVAGFEDVEAIFELIREYPQQLVPRPISDIVQNIDRFLVCKRGDKLVGCVSWQILPEIGAPRSPSVEIKSLAVRQADLRQGIGTRLVGAAIDAIRPLHPMQIIVLTFTPDFFRTFGFQETSKAELMHKIYTGCINCTRYDSPFTCPEVAMKLVLRPAAGAA